MAFPQETFLNARWSDDQSSATPRQALEPRYLLDRVTTERGVYHQISPPLG